MCASACSPNEQRRALYSLRSFAAALASHLRRTYVPCAPPPPPPLALRVASQGPVVVRGLGRYLELKELARRKQEEQREREEKAFGTAATGGVASHIDAAAPPTRPRPFKLSYETPANKQRWEERREEIEREQMVECTFHANTMGSHNVKLIKRIVADDS